MKYRKKPVVVEAIQWTGNNWEDIFAFVCSRGISPKEASRTFSENVDCTITIRTLEGDMIANINDWIICGVEDEFYPCKPDIFEATYEVA